MNEQALTELIWKIIQRLDYDLYKELKQVELEEGYTPDEVVDCEFYVEQFLEQQTQ